MKKRKLNISSIISFSRIIITFIVLLLALFKNYKIALVFIILGIISDFLDNYLAKKMDMNNSKETKLDLIASKFFIIGTIIPLMFKYKAIIVILIFEIINIISNIYYYKKTKRIEILTIGKIKSISLFLTIIISYLNFKFNLGKINNGLILMTINLEMLSIIFYFINYYQIITRKKTNKRKIENEKMINDETVKVNDLIDLAKKYGTYSDDDF